MRDRCSLNNRIKSSQKISSSKQYGH